jgi:hypothetical protein
MRIGIVFELANRNVPKREGIVMRDPLDEQIEAYQAMLPEIKKEHGLVWALVAHRELIKTFGVFDVAARYAVEHFPNEQVLIRHTSERSEMAPFLLVGQ